MEADLQAALQRIQVGALDVRLAGDAINARIKAFEAWLAKLAGRVEASCLMCSSDDGVQEVRLALSRDGKEWRLVIYEYDNRFDEATTEVLLRDASMERKLLAVRAFPKLLDAIAERQQDLVKRVADSAAEFDIFARSIGLKGGE